MKLKTFKNFDLAQLELAVNEWLEETALIASDIVSMQYASTTSTRSGHSTTEYAVTEYSVAILYRAVSPAVDEG